MPTTSEALLHYVSPFLEANSGLQDHRNRLERIDRMVERSYGAKKPFPAPKDTYHEDKRKRNDPASGADPLEVTIPVTGPQLSTLTAQLTKIFLRTDPPIQMFSAPETSEVANQYNILYSKYSRNFQWRRNLLLIIKDAVTYNFCAAEVRWKSKAVRTTTTEIDTSSGNRKTTTAFESGESITHLHPYNVIWDGSVPLNEVSERGAYAGYFDQLTKIALVQYCKNEGIDVSRSDWEEIKALANKSSPSSFYRPKINEVTQNEEVEASYDEIFDRAAGRTTPDPNRKTTTELFDLCVLYVRVVPFDFNIVDSDSTEVNIIKLHILGGSKLLHYEVLNNNHNLFPIIFGQSDESSLGLNSFTTPEELDPIQTTATALYNAEIASTRRMISDRAIFDPFLIDAKEVNNPSPTAKIPLKSAMHGNYKLSDAYFPIPYEDRALGVRLQFANSLLGFANQITSANQVMQGQFVRGNKTAGEFNTTMAMAGDRLLQSAIFLDDQFFSPLRVILLSDTLQYQPNVKLFDRESGSFIEIDMNELIDNQMDFEIASGLLPTDELASTEFFTSLLQVIMSVPQLNLEFDVVEAVCYLAEMRGVKYLRRFRRTPEEIAQQLGLMQASTAAQTEPEAQDQGGDPAQ